MTYKSYVEISLYLLASALLVFVVIHWTPYREFCYILDDKPFSFNLLLVKRFFTIKLIFERAPCFNKCKTLTNDYRNHKFYKVLCAMLIEGLNQPLEQSTSPFALAINQLRELYFLACVSCQSIYSPTWQPIWISCLLQIWAIKLVATRITRLLRFIVGK